MLLPRVLGLLERRQSKASVSREILGILGQDPGVSVLHVATFRLSLHSFEVYSIDFSTMIGDSPGVLNFTSYFSNTIGIYIVDFFDGIFHVIPKGLRKNCVCFRPIHLIHVHFS